MQHSTQIPEIEKLENFNHFAWHCSLQNEGHTILTLSKIEGGIPAFPVAPKYLSNVVKQTLGSSPNKYIDEALTRQVKSLLSSTSLSVQEISDRLGFQNQSHFGTFFKRQTGLSPKAFKEQIM